MSLLPSSASSDARGNARGPKGVAKGTSLWNRNLPRYQQLVSHWLFLPGLLVLLALSLYLPRIAEPEKYLFDEILQAYSAGEYVEGNSDAYRWDHVCSVGKNRQTCVELYAEAQQGDRIGRFHWDHPLAGKLAMAAGIMVFGNDPFGWRISSALAGATGLVIAYQLGLKLSARKAVGILTAGLLLLDTFYFTYSRIGVVDIFLTIVTMSMLLAFASYLKASPDKIRGSLLLTGGLIGLGIATKWSGAYGAFLVGLIVVGRFLLLWRAASRPSSSSEAKEGLRQHLIWGPVALVVLPIAVYLITYLPFFIGGGNTVSDFIALHKAMLQFHTSLPGDPPTASRWWTWPLDLRSVWFGARSYDDGRIANTYAVGNPVLYWAFLPAVIWTVVRWWRARKTVALIVLLVGFFGQWLPWMFVERSTYLYHFLPAVPFGCLAVATTVTYVYEKWRDWRRTLAIEYVVLVALAFAFFYPIASHYPLSDRALGLRMWLSSWI